MNVEKYTNEALSDAMIDVNRALSFENVPPQKLSGLLLKRSALIKEVWKRANSLQEMTKYSYGTEEKSNIHDYL